MRNKKKSKDENASRTHTHLTTKKKDDIDHFRAALGLLDIIYTLVKFKRRGGKKREKTQGRTKGGKKNSRGETKKSGGFF